MPVAPLIQHEASGLLVSARLAPPIGEQWVEATQAHTTPVVWACWPSPHGICLYSADNSNGFRYRPVSGWLPKYNPQKRPERASSPLRIDASASASANRLNQKGRRFRGRFAPSATSFSPGRSDGDRQPLSASAPPTISEISRVMPAWRARLICSVNPVIILPALSVALFIAVMRAPCSLADDSSSA